MSIESCSSCRDPHSAWHRNDDCSNRLLVSILPSTTIASALVFCGYWSGLAWRFIKVVLLLHPNSPHLAAQWTFFLCAHCGKALASLDGLVYFISLTQNSRFDLESYTLARGLDETELVPYDESNSPHGGPERPSTADSRIAYVPAFAYRS